jgi:YYY domain-containing protein
MSVAFTWWLAIELVGLACAPLAATILRNLPDRGWSLTKPLGLLLVGWLIWLPLNVFQALPFSAGWIIGTFLVFVIANVALLRVARVRETLQRLFRESWRYVALTEALFALAFAAMTWERSFTPAAVDTEKFMDEAFLAAIWRAPHLPPPDPWLSGYTLNYYYFGHYLMALFAKALNTVPAVAFNLATGLTFALVCVAIFGVATNIAAVVWRRRGMRNATLLRAAPAGLLSALLTLVAGDLDGFQVWLKQAQSSLKLNPELGGNVWAWWTHHDLWTSYDWWSPSRVIPNTINEFPAFSFVLADLHAHVLALPYAALAVGLALNLLLAHGRGILAFGGRWWALGLLVYAVALGGLYVINGWDLPTYLGLAILALLLQQWLAHGRTLNRDTLINTAMAVVFMGGLAFLLYTPFYLSFSSPAQGVGIVQASARSQAGDVWNYFALPAFLALSYVASRAAAPLRDEALPALVGIWAPARRGEVASALTRIPVGLLAAVPMLLFAWLTALTIHGTGWPALWTAGLVIACVALLLRDVTRPARPAERGAMMLTLLIGCGAGLAMLCEVVYLRDVFGGAYFRMNTVFKFYYQAWLLLGIVSGPALLWVGARAYRAIASLATLWTGATVETPAPVAVGAAGGPNDARAATAHQVFIYEGWGFTDALARTLNAVVSAGWSIALVALLAAAAVYPIQAVAARTLNLSTPRSLDGSAYMATDGVDYGDGPAISWLNTHVSGDVVIVEAAKYDEYTHLGRVSAFTGLPTLLGWGGHELQWRYNWLQKLENANILGQRLNAVNTIYTNPDAVTVLATLHQYHVSYVYVGQAERETYPNADLGRFSGFLPVVYRSASVVIYAVPAA